MVARSAHRHVRSGRGVCARALDQRSTCGRCAIHGRDPRPVRRQRQQRARCRWMRASGPRLTTGRSARFAASGWAHRATHARPSPCGTEALKRLPTRSVPVGVTLTRARGIRAAAAATYSALAVAGRDGAGFCIRRNRIRSFFAPSRPDLTGRDGGSALVRPFVKALRCPMALVTATHRVDACSCVATTREVCRRQHVLDLIGDHHVSPTDASARLPNHAVDAATAA